MLALCRARGLTLGTAESCTGGLVAERLTAIPGVERRLPRRRRGLRGRGEAAGAGRSSGRSRARRRLGRDGGGDGVRRARATGRRRRHCGDRDRRPDGGTPEKPVGLVYLHVSAPHEERGRRSTTPATGSRSADGRRWRRCTSCGASWRKSEQLRETPTGTVQGRDRLRLFCGLTLPRQACEPGSTRGSAPPRAATRDGSRAPTSTSRSPSSALGPGRSSRLSSEALHEAVRLSEQPIVLSPLRYRETRSVGDARPPDEHGRAERLALALLGAPRTHRRVRARSPALASARHRAALPDATAAPPADARDSRVQSVRRGCLPFRARAIRGAV